MARKPAPAPERKEAPINEAAVAEDTAAANTLALATIERNERLTKLAAQLNYGGSTEPAVLENSAREAVKRIGMGIFELGGYLLLLREACAHGTFLPTLERLGIEPRAAQRYMSIAGRFAANASTSTHLERAGMSKLVELLPLDDEQLGELTELGQTGELSLDDVATMSVKQLRAAVRKLRQEKEVADQRSAKKSEELDAMRDKLAAVRTLPPDAALKKLHEEADAWTRDALGAIRGNFRQSIIAVLEAAEHRGQTDATPAAMVARVQAELDALREEFGLPVVDLRQGAGGDFNTFLDDEEKKSAGVKA